MFSNITGAHYRSVYSFETQDRSGDTVLHIIDTKHVSYVSVRHDDTHKNANEYTLTIIVSGVTLEYSKLTRNDAMKHYNKLMG